MRASECVRVCVCVSERVRVGVCVCERVSECATEREKERDVSTLKLEFALTTCYSDDVGRANPFSTHDHPQMNKEPRCRDKTDEEMGKRWTHSSFEKKQKRMKRPMRAKFETEIKEDKDRKKTQIDKTG